MIINNWHDFWLNWEIIAFKFLDNMGYEKYIFIKTNFIKHT